MRYKEIFKLKEMLEKAGIPFEFIDRSEDFIYLPRNKECYEFWQICYPQSDERVCSIIEGFGTFGRDDDLLEIMGLLTESEQEDDCVLGYLTSEEVFERIEKHHKGEKND